MLRGESASVRLNRLPVVAGQCMAVEMAPGNEDGFDATLENKRLEQMRLNQRENFVGLLVGQTLVEKTALNQVALQLGCALGIYGSE